MLTRLGKFALITILCSLLFSLTTSAQAYVWYVDGNQAISGNGTSWFEAFKTIQEAVPWAVGSDEIWVKRGVYPLSSTINLNMKMISIYGGFEGYETEPSQRDLKNNTTTIDGQNLHRVFYVYYGKPRIDGFTIIRGKSGPYYNPNDYMGGAIYFDQCRDLVPVVINCVFTGNVAERVGGAIANYDSSPYILNSSFSGNVAWGNGGAIYNTGDFSIPIITNCTFTNNLASGQVGGWDAGYGDDIYSRPEALPSINNSIIWGNPWGNSIVGPINVTYSNVNQDGFAGINGNIRQDPLLAGSGKLRLRPGSPCIDSGNNTAFPYPWYPVITDYFGNNRIIDGDANGTATVDMGAHEFVPGEVVGVWYVDGAAPPSGNGSSWNQAFRTIGEAVSAAADGDDIYVRAGTYGPVSVNKALNFYGGYEGVTTVDAQNLDGWYGFHISNTSVNIYGFTITRTKASGIHSLNSSLTVTNTIFTANSASQGGGIAVFNGGGATINNCTFTGNSAAFYGGAIYAYGSITGPIAINNSTFTNNHAAREGGAIYSSAASAPLIFNNCTFTNNSSAYSGGAIYSQSPLTLTNSTFSGNSADQGGGALYNTGSSAITGCTFSGNVTGAYSSGGAIFNQSGTHTVSASRLWVNTAAEDGGGIYNSASANLSVLTSIFAANRANGSYGSGGGIKVAQGGAGIVNIINSTFYGNTATYTGGGLFLGELAGTCSQYRVYNSILWANSASQYKETGTSPGGGCPDVYQYSDIDQNNYINYSNNIRQDPMVVNIVGGDPSAWDFHLQAGSPCIDKGSNTVPGLPAFDIDGEPRIMDGNGDTGAKADMGVDEVFGPQDTTPPAGTVLINGGDPFVSYWDVSLTINVTDPSGMSQMCVSNTTSCTSWETFNTNKNWTLTAGDGEKTLYAWFRDFFGNTTAAPIIDTIIIDTTPPVDGTVTATPGINQILLGWSGFSDAASGINAYIVKVRDDQYPTSCDDGVLWYEGLETTYSLGTTTKKYVRVCARDNLWHVSPGVTAAAIPEVDLTPPTGSIVINNGEAYTSQPVVILTISASDPSGVTYYCFSYTPACQSWYDWQPYPPSGPIGWSLSPFVEGVHTVYALFQDSWGNVTSTPYSDTIVVASTASDLVITKSALPNPVLAGTSLTYTIGITNLGPDESLAVTVTDNLPSGPAFVSATSTQGTCDYAGGIVTCGLGSLANGGTATVTIMVTPGTAGWIRNEIQVSSSTYDPSSTNNTAVQDTRVYTAADPDSDGVSSTQESGPAGTNPVYDGNLDGIADSLQANVTSLPTAIGSSYVTLASPDGTALSNVQAGGNPSPGNSPTGVTFPFGFFEFAVNGLTPGGSTTVTFYLPAGAAPNTYYKYGATPGNTTPHWYEFMYDGQTQTGAEINGNVVILHFVDGLRGDDDLTANGVIIDQGGPGINEPPVGSILINNNNPYVNSTDVTLSLNATDPDSVEEMCISNSNTCSSWEAYATTKAWALPGGEGNKTVYAWFKDSSGIANFPPYSDSIILDITAPSDGTLNAAPGPEKVNLTWNGFSDVTSGIQSYKLVWSNSGMPASCLIGTEIYSGADTSYLHTPLTNGARYYYRVCALDNAGNTSIGSTASGTPFPDNDNDNDGISNQKESGPTGLNSNYDGNGDGLSDNQQSNVTSLHAFNGLDYITLASPNGTTLANVQVKENPSPGDSPSGVTFPYGFFDFTVNGLTPEGATTVTLHLPAGAAPNTYYKYGPTPGNTAPHWYEFLYDGQTGAVIVGNVITLHFVDGLRGDDDLIADGIIIDQGGPGLKQEDHKLYLPLIRR